MPGRRALALFEDVSTLSLKQIAVALEVSPQYARLLVRGLEVLGYVVCQVPVIHRYRTCRVRQVWAAGRVQE
ncbi:hypothetical protein [Deinococcus sp. QL22]|uniref:hypothetical protein n=1 Tax=Deinococcus sp. QL22 TaxID=2939437 RepID=UPI002017D425|nr:hypothetical protein [Deinococcus sp. QL22]UQN08259.1 hypothetical protein M1R55_16080 [Deinococcus sp. QL22]